MEQVIKKNNMELLKGIMNAESVQAQFRNALKDNKDAFVASVIDLYNSDKNLQRCDPNALVMECLKAATMKLPINKALGFAYVVPFNLSVKKADGSWDKIMTPTFMPGYKGYIQLAMRTGQYRNINADLVYKGELERKDKLSGAISFKDTRDSDEVVGYFAHFELLNGFSKTLYIDLETMAKHAKRFAASIKADKAVTVQSLMILAGKDPVGLGWVGGFDSMALKTVLRNLLSKYGYLSIEMQTALTSDMAADSMEDRNNAISEAEIQTIDITVEQPALPVGAAPEGANAQGDLPY
jgi:recombination protein RecT